MLEYLRAEASTRSSLSLILELKEEQSSIPPRAQVLKDEQKYPLHRMLLCCDDFEVSSTLFPKRLVGTCYMIPLVLSLCCRDRLSPTRAISLTPPGVSTNQTLKIFIPDIINVIIEGFEGTENAPRIGLELHAQTAIFILRKIWSYLLLVHR